MISCNYFSFILTSSILPVLGGKGCRTFAGISPAQLCIVELFATDANA